MMRKKKLKVLVLILFLILQIEIITSSYTNKFPFLLVQSDEEIAKTEIKMSLNSFGIDWLPDGTPISTANNSQRNPQICSDGAGGAIITWYDYRSGLYSDIYAQRVNHLGNIQWTINGTAICTAGESQLESQLCSNGAGGAIITWIDYRSGSNYDIYVQEVSSSGGIEWNINGTAICTANGDQYAPQLCSDGSGGAIITWYDGRSGSTGRNIYSQSINSSGNIQWTNNGVAICTANNDQWVPQLCSDGSGGAIISWYDNRNIDITGRDIYVQLINSAGNVLWISNGLAICTVNNELIIAHL